MAAIPRHRITADDVGWFGPPPASQCHCRCHTPQGERYQPVHIADVVSAATACEKCRKRHPDPFRGLRRQSIRKPWDKGEGDE